MCFQQPQLLASCKCKQAAAMRCTLPSCSAPPGPLPPGLTQALLSDRRAAARSLKCRLWNSKSSTCRLGVVRAEKRWVKELKLNAGSSSHGCPLPWMAEQEPAAPELPASTPPPIHHAAHIPVAQPPERLPAGASCRLRGGGGGAPRRGLGHPAVPQAPGWTRAGPGTRW